MADLADGLARYLAARGLLTYDPTGTRGDTFIGTMPPAPDEAVALTLYGDGTTTDRDGADLDRLQIRVRGTADPRKSYDRCLALRDALHGLAGVELPDGTWLVLATAPRPSPMGTDANGRHEHVTNAALDIAAPTTP
ncbi:minor capsid protein [Streptomyces althioticus]|uniref:minor capsid protein n=1 Tax=Streptomyces althioticus TaxID=83380 RepID=UPI00343ADC32